MATRPNALAKREAALARARANQSATLARARARNNAMQVQMRDRLRKFRDRQSVKTSATLAAVGVGAITGGQVARMQIFKDANGKSRAPWVNYISGVVGFGLIVTGRVTTMESMMAAGAAFGMGVGQLAIKSYLEWDLVPFDIGGA